MYALGAFDGTYMDSVEKYDPQTNRWTFVAPMICSRSSAAAAVCGGLLFVMGGWNGLACRTIECYDPIGDKWTVVGSMSQDRVGLCCAVHNDETVEVPSDDEMHLLGSVVLP